MPHHRPRIYTGAADSICAIHGYIGMYTAARMHRIHGIHWQVYRRTWQPNTIRHPHAHPHAPRLTPTHKTHNKRQSNANPQDDTTTRRHDDTTTRRRQDAGRCEATRAARHAWRSFRRWRTSSAACGCATLTLLERHVMSVVSVSYLSGMSLVLLTL